MTNLNTLVIPSNKPIVDVFEVSQETRGKDNELGLWLDACKTTNMLKVWGV